MAQAELANLIEAHLNELVLRWLESVRADERIKSDDDLSEGGLIDHVPVIVEEICGMLRTGAKPSVLNTREARVHSYTRFCQGFRARDLVSETSHLRHIMLDHVGAQLFRLAESARLDSYLEAARTINLYLDEELRYAVAIYTESSPAATLGADTRLFS